MKTYQFCRRQLALGLGFLFMALLLSMNQVQQQREALAQRIAPALLRFHILANSDSSADQQVKLEVRSLILDYIQELLPPEQGKKETIRCLREQKAAIEKTASQYLAQRGYPYGAELEITRCYFPTRVYDNMVIPVASTMPPGLRWEKGKGHNWWCVLYPRFCFVDAACKEIPKESRSQLRNQINQDDYLALENHRPDFEFRFRLFPSFSFSKSPAPDYSTAASPVMPQS